MKVLMVSKALVVASYRSKLSELSRLGIDLTAVIPESWTEEGREIGFEPAADTGYTVIRTKLAWSGHFHVHYYKSLARIIREVQPDVLHMDEEPYNLATYLAFRSARAIGARRLFFTWQNIERRYPLPFRSFERSVYNHADFAIAGNEEALNVLRAKGYAARAEVIPQFGADINVFRPGPPREGPFTIGYVGRLIPEKGIADLLSAFGRLESPARLVIAGDGPLAGFVDSAAARWRQEGRFERYPRIPSGDVPALLHRLDVVVLPSRTSSAWKEQFGRVLVEAMASGVPVIGSNSGEIPNVIGDAGLVVPENNALELATALRRLCESAQLRATLSEKGRQRAVERFSQASIASRTAHVYEQLA
jgi:glycosyltransferase involved in cell wall biosynthesis